jgi:uncharacterized protein (TIGR01777 family)
MKIVIAGGNGHVGAALLRAFARQGSHELAVLTRRAVKSSVARQVIWDAKQLGAWTAEIDGADAVINLAGKSVDCRYTERNLREMRRSRLETTRLIGQAIAAAPRPPAVWLQASTATIYSHRFDAPNDEHDGILGGDRGDYTPHEWLPSVYLARDWEKAWNEAVVPHTRKIALRSALTLSPDAGSAFSVLARLARLGLGGAQGGGKQWVSWIHEHDFTRAIQFLIDRRDVSGVINVCAPQPVLNSEFCRALRVAAGRNAGLPLPRWAIEIGAVLLRTESELLLKSRYVIPTRLQAAGFVFDYPSWPEAARELASRRTP